MGYMYILDEVLQTQKSPTAEMDRSDASAAEEQLRWLQRFLRCRRETETLKEWAEANLSEAACRRLASGGFWVDVVHSKKYDAGPYEYRHVHLPTYIANRLDHTRLLRREELYRIPGVVLSPGWEHYVWHRREPHILCVRRLQEEPPDGFGGGIPQYGDRVAPEPLREHGGQSPPKGDDEPQALDEILASRGLSPKLFHHQFVESWALSDVLEGVARKIVASEACRRAKIRATSRGFAVLAAIRGPADVQWTAGKLGETYLQLLLSSEPTNVVLQQLALLLLADHSGRGEPCASHANGKRLSPFSLHVLEAMSTGMGSRGATRACYLLEGPLAMLLSVDPVEEEVNYPAELEEKDVVLMLLAFAGNAPAPRFQDNLPVQFASDCESVNVGWAFLHWGVLSQRCRFGPLSAVSFELAMRGLSETSARQLRALGIDSAEGLESKRRSLSRPAPHGLLDPFLFSMSTHVLLICSNFYS